MIGIRRGEYIGKALGEPPATRPSISFDARPAAAGSIAVISAKCSSTKARCHTRRRINHNDGRTVRNSDRRHAAHYRDQKD